MSQPISQFAIDMMRELDEIMAEPDQATRERLLHAFGQKLFKNYSKRPAPKDWARQAAGDNE